MVNVQRPLGRDVSIDVNLNNMCARPIETHICKESHIVGVAVIFNDKFGGYRNHDFFSIGRQYFHLGFELALAYPMIDDRKLQECRWKALKENVLEYSHQRQFVAHLEPHIVADDRIYELCIFHNLCPKALEELIVNVVESAVRHDHHMISRP